MNPYFVCLSMIVTNRHVNDLPTLGALDLLALDIQAEANGDDLPMSQSSVFFLWRAGISKNALPEGKPDAVLETELSQGYK